MDKKKNDSLKTCNVFNAVPSGTLNIKSKLL